MALTGVLAAVVLAATPGTALADQTTTGNVTVRADQALAEIRPGAIGVNTPIWNPRLVDPAVPGLIRQAGIRRLEFNGGGVSDLYHWRDGSVSADPDAADHPYDYAALPPQFSFDQFAATAQQTHADMLVHVNYGTGTPEEAAAWVTYANRVKHYHIKDWAIGEEVWGNGSIPGVNFEPDAHADKSAAAYGRNALAFIAAMKAADPGIRVGVELTGVPAGVSLPGFNEWDQGVMSTVGGAADFVDFHEYPFGVRDTSDKGLLGSVRQLPANLAALRALVDRYAGRGRHVDLVVGETNSAAFQAPQQISVFNALYLADDMLTLLENGTTGVAWWALHNGGYGDTHGDLGLLSTGDCDDTGTVCAPPADTPYPPYYGLQLTGALARPGGTLVATSSADPLVVTHAVREPDGSLAVLLLNEDPTNARKVCLDVRGYRAGGDPTVLWYGPGVDRVQVTHQAGRTRTLPAYSLTEMVFAPAR